MSKQSKRPNRRDRNRYNSSLGSHKQHGKILKPPFNTLPGLTLRRWDQDFLPDMLWLCSHLHHSDQRKSVAIIAYALDLLSETVASPASPSEEAQVDDLTIDGRLASFERVGELHRAAFLAKLSQEATYEDVIPEQFAHSLGMYPEAPGSWLLRPWVDRGLSINWEVAQQHLGSVILDSLDGRGEIATIAKAFTVGRFATAGRMSFTQDMDLPFDAFGGYPFNISHDDRKRIDGFSRASYMAVVGGSDDFSPEGRSSNWARLFWQSNWRIFPCVESESNDEFDPNAQHIDGHFDIYSKRVDQIYDRFLTKATATDPDVYSPDRFEVLTGMAARAIRIAAAAVSSPSLWSAEFGSGMVRSLVETLIVMRWLVHKNDTALYTKFKDYGRGRLKLLKLHVEEYVDSEAEPSKQLLAYLSYLDSEVNMDTNEEFQDVSIESTFGGISVRDMSKQVNMEREYRLLFAPASSVSHGEWAYLDRYSLVRCGNPLHRGHRIPRSSIDVPLAPQTLDTMLGLVEDIIDTYIATV